MLERWLESGREPREFADYPRRISEGSASHRLEELAQVYSGLGISALATFAAGSVVVVILALSGRAIYFNGPLLGVLFSATPLTAVLTSYPWTRRRARAAGKRFLPGLSTSLALGLWMVLACLGGLMDFTSYAVSGQVQTEDVVRIAMITLAIGMASFPVLRLQIARKLRRCGVKVGLLGLNRRSLESRLAAMRRAEANVMLSALSRSDLSP